MNQGKRLWLALNAPISKFCFLSHLLKCLRSLYGKQCGPRAVCSGSRLLASIINLSVMLGNYLQQATSADNIFRCIFFLGALRVNVFNSFLSNEDSGESMQMHIVPARAFSAYIQKVWMKMKRAM